MKKIFAWILLLVMIISIIVAAVGSITMKNYEQENIATSQIIVEDTIIEQETITPIIEETYVTKYAITKLNIRQGPSTKYDIIKQVNLNTELQIIEDTIEDEWVQVKIDDNKYYVNSKYLSNTKIAEASVKETSNVSKADNNTAAANCVGYYTLTYYCSCSKCCGKTNGITAWGTKATAGRTIATSSKFAFGTKLIIDGHEYTVEDRGGAIQGNKIDIFVNTHAEALKLGVKKNVPVYSTI